MKSAFLAQILKERERYDIKLSGNRYFEIILFPMKDRWRGNAFGRQRGHINNLSEVIKKEVLKSYLPCQRASLQLRRDCFGKPYCNGVTARKIHFSVSYAYGLMAIAVGNTRLGVDIEHINPYTMLAPQISSFHGENCLQAWVRNEAFVKATGKGLLADASVLSFDDEPVTLLNFSVSNSYYLSLAITNKNRTILI